MTKDDFLDDEALVKLTGRRRKSMQITELRRLGLPFFVNAHGDPVVARSAIEGGELPDVIGERTQLAELQCPYVGPVIDGVPAAEWIKENGRRFLFDVDHIVSSAIDYRQIRDHQHPGIYFLLLDGNIVYVGKSTNIYWRVWQHFSEKMFSDVFCFEAPEAALDFIESYYINTMRPLLNSKFPRMLIDLSACQEATEPAEKVR